MKTVLAQLKQYKKASYLTMGFTTLEVIMEVLLPFVTAMTIDEGIQKADLSAILKMGLLMVNDGSNQPVFRSDGRQIFRKCFFRVCL